MSDEYFIPALSQITGGGGVGGFLLVVDLLHDIK